MEQNAKMAKINLQDPAHIQALVNVSNAGIALKTSIKEGNFYLEPGSDMHIAMCTLDLECAKFARLLQEYNRGLEEEEKNRAASNAPASQGICPNCGEPGPHFAPPSLGEEGFYTCNPKGVASTDFDKLVNRSNELYHCLVCNPEKQYITFAALQAHMADSHGIELPDSLHQPLINSDAPQRAKPGLAMDTRTPPGMLTEPDAGTY